jgi:rhodanese-related sulfurtransferase
MSHRDIEPQAAQAELQSDQGLRVLDVRTPREHQSHRLAGSILIPLQELHLRVQELDADAHWLVHCEHGVRSLAACRMLAQAGFEKLTNLRGGIAHWMSCGLPIER